MHADLESELNPHIALPLIFLHKASHTTRALSLAAVVDAFRMRAWRWSPPWLLPSPPLPTSHSCAPLARPPPPPFLRRLVPHRRMHKSKEKKRKRRERRRRKWKKRTPPDGIPRRRSTPLLPRPRRCSCGLGRSAAEAERARVSRECARTTQWQRRDGWHHTQMVWRRTTAMGCALATCFSGYPSGNYVGAATSGRCGREKRERGGIKRGREG